MLVMTKSRALLTTFELKVGCLMGPQSRNGSCLERKTPMSITKAIYSIGQQLMSSYIHKALGQRLGIQEAESWFISKEFITSLETKNEGNLVSAGCWDRFMSIKVISFVLGYWKCPNVSVDFPTRCQEPIIKKKISLPYETPEEKYFRILDKMSHFQKLIISSFLIICLSLSCIQMC